MSSKYSDNKINKNLYSLDSLSKKVNIWVMSLKRKRVKMDEKFNKYDWKIKSYYKSSQPDEMF